MIDGTIIAVFKVFAYALTAGSGVLGLLTEFKNEHKQITPTGKLALVGIVVGFGFSVTMTVAEARQSRVAEREHEKEIKRLARPLGDMDADFDFSIDSGRNPEVLNPVYDFIKRTLRSPSHFKRASRSSFGHETGSGVGFWYKFVPHRLGSLTSPSPFEGTSIWDIDFYKRGAVNTCNELNSIPLAADLNLRVQSAWLDEDSSAEWFYNFDDGSLALRRTLKVRIQHSTGEIMSVDDLVGSTMTIWSNSTERDGYDVNGLSLHVRTASQGIDVFSVPEGAFTSVRRRWQLGYCYKFPTDLATTPLGGGGTIGGFLPPRRLHPGKSKSPTTP